MKNLKQKNKLIVVALLIVLFAIISTKNVLAHNVEIEANPAVTLPGFVFNGEGTFMVWSKDANYKLYWQAVEISSTNVSKIKKIEEDGKKELAEIKQEMDALYAEAQNIQDKQSEEYSSKVQQYNAKVKENNEKVAELNNEIKALIPDYVEGKWIETTDKKFAVDLSNYTGEKDFVVWVKLVDTEGTHYNETIYTMNGTKKDINVTEIKLDKNELTLTEGGEYTFTATIKPTDATNKSITWSSSDEKVAKVESGKVTAISEGTATITAKTVDGNYTDTCKVTVTKKEEEKKDIKVTAIKLNESTLLLKEGEKSKLTATITPTDAKDKTVTWSSSDEKVVTVKDGEITAIKEGTATITVKTNDGEYTDTCKITVTKKVEEPKADPTVSDKPIAQTGGSFIIAGAIIALVGLCIVLYKKNKSFNWK